MAEASASRHWSVRADNQFGLYCAWRPSINFAEELAVSQMAVVLGILHHAGYMPTWIEAKARDGLSEDRALELEETNGGEADVAKPGQLVNPKRK